MEAVVCKMRMPFGRQSARHGLLLAGFLSGFVGAFEAGHPLPEARRGLGAVPSVRWSLRVVQAWPAHPSWVYGVAWLPGSRRLVSVGADDTVRLWQRTPNRTVSLIAQWNPGMGSMFAVAVLDAERFVTAGREDRVLLWRLPAGEWTVLGRHESDVEALAVIPEAGLVFSGGRDRIVAAWTVGGGEMSPERWEGHTGAVVGLAVSPDRRWLASAGEDGTVIVWSVAGDRRPVTVYTEHRRSVRTVAFVTDEVIASGDMGGMLHLWRRDDGRLLWKETAHRGWVTQVVACAVEPSGPLGIVTAGTDRWVRLWGWDGERLTVFDERREHAQPVLALALSDRCELASGGMDGWIRVWEWVHDLRVAKVRRGLF
jgi:WD40 repeat protein